MQCKAESIVTVKSLLSWLLVYLTFAVSFSHLSCLSSAYIYMCLSLLNFHRTCSCTYDIPSALLVKYCCTHLNADAPTQIADTHAPTFDDMDNERHKE